MDNFTVTVTRLDGADGETMYSSDGFRQRDANRLADLKNKYPTQ